MMEPEDKLSQPTSDKIKADGKGAWTCLVMGCAITAVCNVVAELETCCAQHAPAPHYEFFPI
jgi:hypothetical protein